MAARRHFEEKTTVGVKQLYINDQLPKYNIFCVYFHIPWARKVNSDEM